jgi:hypothetical protein
MTHQRIEREQNCHYDMQGLNKLAGPLSEMRKLLEATNELKGGLADASN